MNVAIIPARGGSKRIPGKNIKLFHGKPIIAYSIKAAQDSGIFDRIIVSTDSVAIADVAREYGAEVMMRPAALADDATGTNQVVRHVITELGVSHSTKVCCIYPCAPMIDPEDIVKAMDRLTVFRMLKVVPVGTWLQDPGMFYVGRASFKDLPHHKTMLLPIDPRRAIDINTPEDWAKAEQMYKELHNGI